MKGNQKVTEAQVLDYIRTHQSVTRQEIARVFGISEATVSGMIAELTRSQKVWCVGLGGKYHYEMAQVR